MRNKLLIFLSFLLLLYPLPAIAAEAQHFNFALNAGLPFVFLLLGIALIPLFLPHFWHHHYGKFALCCAIGSIIFMYLYATDVGAVSATITHIALDEYLPFLLLLAALFCVSGGIYFNATFVATPAKNVALLFIGTILASLMGTTGAAMLLIRPLLRANKFRQYRTHTFVFFIFLVANIGGSLTPLGDPPLFLGFLKGVSFFWLLEFMWWQVVLTVGILLLIYYLMDLYYYKNEPQPTNDNDELPTAINPQAGLVLGKINILFLFAICSLVLYSGMGDHSQKIAFLGYQLPLTEVVRDLGMVTVIILSLVFTPRQVRVKNDFSWEPIIEVAKLFAAIFITLYPVMSMLAQGVNGPFSALLTLTNDGTGQPSAARYFWITGILSGFLDNAPTYLISFNLAGGSAVELMGELSSVLTAISMGAVFMGALSYIGNAPNMMVRSVVEAHGSKMPSFIGYMLWSGVILLPVFLLLTFICFVF